jgi:hypothetical protein
MAKKSLQIRGLFFPTRKAANEHFRAILWGHPHHTRIPEPNATDLRWLLERHHEFEQKAGAGIDFFIVVPTIYSAVGFNIVLTDGSTADFCYITALDGSAPSARRETLAALRWELTDDILRAKSDYFAKHADADGTVACAISGKRVTFKQTHADHAPPYFFGTLANAFLAARNIELTPDLLEPSADHQVMRLLADRKLAENSRAYHHKLAVIRVVAATENVARAGQAKVRKKDRQLRLI